MNAVALLGIPIIGDIWDAVTGVFTDVAGWAIDAVIGAITTWVIGGVLAVIETLWNVLDTTSRPIPTADWFSGGASSPFGMAVQIGGTVLAITVLLAIVRGVLAGSPGAVARVLGCDVPTVVMTTVATIGLTQIGLDIADSISDWVWQTTRPQAAEALENLALVLRAGLPGTHFAGIVIAVLLLAAMFFLWVVLVVRESLVYVVLVFSAAFAWPAMVFAPFRDTAKKSAEMLVALIICKPIITLAMSIGISAMAGIGDTGEPGGPVVENALVEFGTLLVGVVTFGMAAFMPFLVWRLMPLAAAALVAQGVASSPLRAAQTGMQLQYYTSSTMNRLSAGGTTHLPVPGAARASSELFAAVAGQSARVSDGRTSTAGSSGRLAAGPAAVLRAGERGAR